jgi:BMFP domain-containing protein YqiC
VIAANETKAGTGPEYLDTSGAGIAARVEKLAFPNTLYMNESGMRVGVFQVATLVMQVERERTDAARQCAAEQREKRKALQQTIADLDDELNRAKSVVQDMTAIIAAKCDQERTLSEQIAAAIAPMLDTDPSDMELPELVGALIDFALGEHARAQVMSMEPEEAPGVFLVLNADGRITGPVHDSEKKAREWAAQGAEHRQGAAFTIARRIAHCNTRVVIDWKEA